MSAGKVFLVGAGPGDADLLTVKAVRALEKADVVVYDRLVSQSIMDLIPSHVRKIDVGKNAGNHPVPQHRINEILKEEAQKGNLTVRLKSGDPFVFGRGGEELEYLCENGVEFEAVPGITSPLAVPAYAGIPVTHRDFCSSLHIITGHAKAGKDLDIDFESLVKLNGTLIFMMSVATIDGIAEGLMQAGMDKDMPCAVIENGTRTDQRKFISTLDQVGETVRLHHVQSPAVIAVGKVCRLSFDWFSGKPLKNKRIILTLPQRKQSALAQMLHDMGADVLTYPCIETKALPDFDVDAGDCSVLVFTSAAGVESYFERLLAKGMDARSLAGKKIACIGEKTGAKLRQYGMACDFLPSVYDGETLAQEMIGKGFISQKDKVLLLRAEWASPVLAEVLRRHSIDFCERPVYSTAFIAHEPLDLSDYDYITFTSGSCVEGFLNCNPEADCAKIKAVCIGKSTAAKAKAAGFPVLVSDKATMESMCDRLRSDAAC